MAPSRASRILESREKKGMRLNMRVITRWTLPVFLVFSVFLTSCGLGRGAPRAFILENANIYFLMTDRFANGDATNDHAYGRGLASDGSVDEAATYGPGGFHGGDFEGITEKINEGYFDSLGVDAIWVTPPFEQIHGARSGPGFPFYAYHGYWTLDFTVPDAAYGTQEDFRAMVDAAHAKNIRIILDVVLNHPGYATPEDAEEFGFGSYEDGWEAYVDGPDESLSPEAEAAFVNRDSAEWQNWWGSDWVRSDDALEGYDTGMTGDTTMCLSGLPDFKNESTELVELPVFLAAKWEKEGRLQEEQDELDAFFAASGLPRTVLNYQIKWLTDWVRDYGVDGFRCDTAKHVELSAWSMLETYAGEALEDWRTANPMKLIDEEPFFTIGEVWDHGVTKDAYYTEAGFDALINFSFRKNAMNLSLLPKVYTYMSDTMHADDFCVVSYISSHDTALFTRSMLKKGMIALLLSPGAVQIFYGDETGRPRAWPECPYMDLTMRSPMNWEDPDEELQAFVGILGKFRQRHPAIGAGVHAEISAEPYLFARTMTASDGKSTDTVIVGITEPDQIVSIPIGVYFAEGERLVNAADGSVATVTEGAVEFSSGPDGLILIEKEGGTP